MLHHQGKEQQFALLAVGGQVGANRVLGQLARKRRVGQDDLVAAAQIVLGEAAHVRQRKGWRA